MKPRILLFIFLVFLLSVTFIYGVSEFTTNPSIPNTTDRSQPIICRWNVSVDVTHQNITWFNGSLQYVNQTIPLGTRQAIIESPTHKRGENWTCQVTIWDGAELNRSNASVIIKNADPDIVGVFNDSGMDIQNSTYILEDTAYSFDLNATDLDGDTLSYSDNATQFNIDSSTGVFSWTPTVNDVGVHPIQFIISDGYSSDLGLTGKVITFNITAVNDAPTFSPALTNQNATEDVPWNYTIYGDDEEDDTPFGFSMTTNNSNLVLVTLDTTSALINFTAGAPGFADVGTWYVNITINDSYGANSTSSFILNVSQTNHAPNLSLISNITSGYTQGDNLLLYVNATDLDTDDVLVFSINTSGYNLTQINNSYLSASALINLTPTNNTHVLNPWVNISVSDGSLTDWQVVFINITNANDAPQIHNVSSYAVNTGSNSNINNLTGYSGLTFKYRINASDPDQLTYEGDSINFTVNNSNFTLDNTTGIFNFTPGTSLIGNWSVLITVMDAAGATDNVEVILRIINNSVPYFDEPILNTTCFEDVLCTLNINGTDLDGDIINFNLNTSGFSINNESGLMNFTPAQSQIGNYSLRIYLNDTKGAYNYSDFILTINNTNDAPVLSSISFPIFVVNHSVSYDVNATDQDMQLTGSLAYDNITFYIFNQTSPFLFNITSTGIISFTPNDSVDGNHSINITVNDTLGAQDSIIINFTIYEQSNPPVIENITPYGAPLTTYTTFGWAATSNFPNNITRVNASENYTLLFNHSTTNEVDETLTYYWYYDGTLVTTGLLENNHTLNYSFNFFSNGTHNLTLVVEDDRYESSQFTWNLSVNNSNRIPVQLNALPNLTIAGIETYSGYFSFANGTTRFIDPDDDVNGDNMINNGESNRLTFTPATTCAAADLTVTGADLRIEPSSVGTCTPRFNASDGEYTIQSNIVIINITDTPEQTTTVTQTSGGGGSSTTRITIPIPEEVEIPKAIEIIASDVIVIYQNQTIIVPFELRNTWNDTIYGVNISAETNTTNVTMQFQKTFYRQLETDEVQKNSLTLTNYREGETFEIKISANVTEPTFQDSASIYINSLEQFSEGEDVSSKITFARDLLASNPECQELHELLGKAQEALDQGRSAEASRLVEGVIQGCKYLINEATKVEEQPKKFDSYFLFGNEYITYGALGAFGLLIFISTLSFITSGKKSKKKEPSEQPKTKA